MKNLCLLLFFLLCPGIVLSQQVEQCQSLLSASVANPQCSPVGSNCTGLRCEQRGNALNGSSVSFAVVKCEDPVIVNLTIQSSSMPRQGSFTRNMTTYLGGNSSISVAMRRNASYLQFQADLTDEGGVVIPTVFIPLNASDCMCSSLADVARVATHPVIEPECSTNDNCDGVYCELNIVGLRFYLEVIVLPCQNALDVLVEDSSRRVLHSEVYNRNETRSFTIGIISMTVEVVIIPHEYSMDVQTFVTDSLSFFSRVEVTPLHKIILDKTNCSGSNIPNTPIPTVAPPTAPPPPVPPPVDAPETCHAFFRIIQSNQSQHFICGPLDQCERGITCRLSLLDTHYHINISLTSANNFALVVEDGPTDTVISTTSGRNATVLLPKPQGGRVEFKQNRLIAAVISQQLTIVSFQLDLIVPDLAQFNQGSDLTSVLIPLTTITIPLGEEVCSVLRQYSNLNPQCVSLGTCSGAQCQQSDNVATFAVNKCVDPVTVDLEVQSRRSGEVRVQQQLNHSDSLFNGGSSLYVEMGRNASDLQFEVTVLREGSSNVTLIPQATVPLNASECMCQSLQNLATKAGSTVVEPECQTNTECNGIVCELDIFGSVFYLESIILPCNYAVDVVVRDSQRQALFMSVYNRTETHTISIGIFSASLYVEIVRHPYSMEVSATILDVLFFGNITLVPRHTIILDKTQCHPPHIILVPPPTAPPLPTPPPPSSSETCKALYDIVRKTHTEQFFCQLKKDCDAGILCTLEILNTFYTVDITLRPEDKVVVLSVTDSNGAKVGLPTSKNGTVSLPRPQRTMLVFNQSVSAEKGTIGFSLALSAPNLGSDSSRLHVYSLIDYSEVPFTESKVQPQTSTQDSTVAIAVPIIIFVVLCLLSLLVALGCMVYCRKKHTIPPFQMQFQKMRGGVDQDDLEILDSKPENHEFEPDEVKADLGNDFSPIHSDDQDRYEKPAQLDTGTIV